MKPPLLLRDLSCRERQALDEALHARHDFTRRRAQILRFSAQGLRPSQIADGLGCTSQTVRNAVHAFHEHGLESLNPRPMGPKNPRRIFDADAREWLMEMAHQSPRPLGKPRSTWTLDLLAEISFEQGVTEEQVSRETIRQAIHALGSSWQRAKHWITSPDPQYALKKNNVIA